MEYGYSVTGEIKMNCRLSGRDPEGLRFIVERVPSALSCPRRAGQRIRWMGLFAESLLFLQFEVWNRIILLNIRAI